MTAGPLVVGLGSPDRGDDAVGPLAARVVAALGVSGVTVIEHEDPTGLIDTWSGTSLTVVIDAVRTGAPPGSVVVVEAGAHADPIVEDAWASAGRGGTHAFGLAAAVELARALGKLPERLVLVGVEAAGFEHGAEMSAPVLAALDDVVATVLALVESGAAVPALGGRGAVVAAVGERSVVVADVSG